MELLPDFRLFRPRSLDRAIAARGEDPAARLLAGGTDLIPNMRRGLVESTLVIDLSGIEELRRLEVAELGAYLGAAATLADVADHPGLQRDYTAVAEAAGTVAGPTQREMGTVGGNICLDTRCLFYNQSEWWRNSVGYCLKYRGETCHVVPTGKRCYATYSGDLAAALLIHDAEVDLAGPGGRRRLPLGALFTDDGARPLALGADELLVGVHLPPAAGLASTYGKIRVRGSIDFPLAGVAVGLRRGEGSVSALRVALSGTNSRPLLVDGTDEFVGRPFDEGARARLEHLVEKAVSPVKTTLIQPQYRRRAIAALAARLAAALATTRG